MSWRYVASRELLDDGLGGTEETWCIRELYDNPLGWSTEAVAPRGDKWIELMDDLSRMGDGAGAVQFLDLTLDPPALRPLKGFRV